MPFVAPVGTRRRCGGPSQRVPGCPRGSESHVRPYLHESPATEEHLAMAAVKIHRHAMIGPEARLRFEITMEHALNAPTAVTTFRQHDCAPQMDGAAARVIAAEDALDRSTDRPGWFRGVGLGLDSVMHQHKPDMTLLCASTKAAEQGFSPAGTSPGGVDVAGAHDFEPTRDEDLGFAERPGGYPPLEAEVTSLGAAQPVNLSGGFTAHEEPGGAP